MRSRPGSSAAPAMVTGTVMLDKDFGMGYQYDIIVEDAEVTVEATGS